MWESKQHEAVQRSRIGFEKSPVFKCAWYTKTMITGVFGTHIMSGSKSYKKLLDQYKYLLIGRFHLVKNGLLSVRVDKTGATMLRYERFKPTAIIYSNLW